MTAFSIAHDAWVMVGDGEKALFFRNEGDDAHLNLEIVDVLEHDNPPNRDQATDRPGRAFSSAGDRRSAMDEPNYHRIEKHRFAKEIAETLYMAAHRGRFDKLIIAAPPATLGDLRKELHKEVVQRLVAEVPKNLTNIPPHEIERILIEKS